VVKIVTVRRICQVFFFCLFVWFCIVTSFGTEWYRLRGWPVNLILQLDPLVAIGTLLTTHTLYRGLLWALATVVLTIVFGRVFCGWICPFGAFHQFVGWLGARRRKLKDRIKANRYRKAAVLKYFFLIAFLTAAAIPMGSSTVLLTGLLDPIPFFHRAFNIIVLPVADGFVGVLSVAPRVYDGAFLVGALFLVVAFMNLVIPRFYCRFLCPTGALLGLVGKYAIWRIGKGEAACSNCMQCEKACEGGCSPAGEIRINECVLCFNCLDRCHDGVMVYATLESKGGEIALPDMTRRGLIVSSVSGLFAARMFPLATGTATADSQVIRPPGTLPETEFLQRCVKCGQCMRICPTNIIVPSGISGGLENLWTPVLNFTDGTSGCQLNCTACGHVCPTSAIRPIGLTEKLGVDEFIDKGPIRIGSAYVDRTRCLPWAMKTPCIVCQENCPVTPKAIFVDEVAERVRDGRRDVRSVQGDVIRVSGPAMEAGQYATGDFYLVVPEEGGEIRRRISGNGETDITLTSENSAAIQVGSRVEIKVLLHRPHIDLAGCVGCGTCVHECPLGGTRAIRVTPDNESRSMKKVA
jgi:polyferredoxin